MMFPLWVPACAGMTGGSSRYERKRRKRESMLRFLHRAKLANRLFCRLCGGSYRAQFESFCTLVAIP